MGWTLAGILGGHWEAFFVSSFRTKITLRKLRRGFENSHEARLVMNVVFVKNRRYDKKNTVLSVGSRWLAKALRRLQQWRHHVFAGVQNRRLDRDVAISCGFWTLLL